MDILHTIARYRMISPGDSVLVAASGGADSVTMLHALHTNSGVLGITLHVAHMNHGIRGVEADADEEFVRRLAREMGLPITVRRVSVPEMQAELRAGEEETARAVRYGFLQEACAALGCNKIAVGHTADDRAESVLLNIVRGTGIEGLGSIRPVNGNVVRPLIDTWRTEVEAYVTAHGLDYRTDHTNLDTSYTRNRVRHELIPLLESSFNPQVRQALVRLARVAGSQSELMDQLADRAASECGYAGQFDARLVMKLPEALQYQLVRAEIERAKGDPADVTFEQIERVVEALRSGEDFTIALLTGGIYAERHGDGFRIGPRQEPPEIEPFERAMAIPGKTKVPEAGLTIFAKVLDKVEMMQVAPNVALIDSDSVNGKLCIRNARPGDRIRPFGMHGTKKLQDVFVDGKVPQRERAMAAVVVDDEKILWVVGVVASDEARVTAKTRNIIRLAAAIDR